MENYNQFCKDSGCDQYIEWDYELDSETPPYQCISCIRVGPSYDIEEYPDDCPNLTEIRNIKLEP